ncbi:hypothetical protein BJX61DRAFT_515848 [Aspergillus egyptiacus]|nr:hypothetical protein BJX61DRAFT_515848 [Aspergillus egyptiacus]
MKQRGNKLSGHVSRTVLWALLLPAAIAGHATTDSAAASRSGPDQTIVDIVPVQNAPQVSVNSINHVENNHDLLPLHGHNKHTPADEPILLPRSSSSTFPTAFNTNLSSNFTTSSCPEFFDDFLSDSTFTNCHAISTLLRDSTEFFHILSSAASTSHVLDIACSADVTACAETMSTFASDLLDDSNCGRDHEDGNPLVANAYYNMITYEPIYRATCLQDPETTNYCFVDAVTNTSNPADYDVYLLPYGSTLHSKPLPTCDACLQATLDIFSKWAQVDGQPLAESYLPSALAVNRQCREGFAKVNVTTGQDDAVSSASVRLSSSFSFWASLVGMGALLTI